MPAKRTRIVIVGAGFGGLHAALHLEKLFSRNDEVAITLINDENFFLFTPMLPEVPSGSIEAKHIVSPVRASFCRVTFQQSAVHAIDCQKRFIRVAHCARCRPRELEFEHLVLALGSVTNFHDLPGVAEHAFPMKTLGDAMTLRNHVIDLFEHADLEHDPDLRTAMLTFVVCGGGFAGAETVAELRDFAYTARRYYPNVRPEEVRVILVHAGPRIMPEINEGLASYALTLLRKRGVHVWLNTGIRGATAGSVELTHGESIPTRTLIWTAGASPSPLLAALPFARNRRGQIIVNEYLGVPGAPGIWALGDCAEIPNPTSGRPYPPTAQHAVREGRIVAANVAAAIRGGEQTPFSYRPLGMLAALGRRSAVAEILGFKFSGFLAWWLWRTVYLFKLPGLERKLRVAMDWTLDLFFPRDIVLLKTLMKQDRGGGRIDEVLPQARVPTARTS